MTPIKWTELHARSESRVVSANKWQDNLRGCVGENTRKKSERKAFVSGRLGVYYLDEQTTR